MVDLPLLSRLKLPRLSVMGILNVTPDSFSDGGVFDDCQSAIVHAKQMLSEGAHIIDVGGESTRPGAKPVSIEDELARVIPVISAIKSQHPEAVVSIDTSKPEVMLEAANAGADMINDVKALQMSGALGAAKKTGLPVCLMHMQGEPRTMQTAPNYEDVVKDVAQFFADRLAACDGAGIERDDIILDPGFGFGKLLRHNLQLLGGLSSFLALGHPILVGISRKSMIGQILDAPVDERLYGSLAAAVMAATKGAHIFRVHDVKPTVQALSVAAATLGVVST